MENSERHVNNWNVRTERRYAPFRFLNQRFDQPGVPPVVVQVSVEFDDNASALDFERKVRDLLEEA